MSGLTNLDKQNLSAVAGDAAWKQFVRMTSSNPSDIARRVMLALYPEIEAIVARAVVAALNDAADHFEHYDEVSIGKADIGSNLIPISPAERLRKRADEIARTH